MRIARPCTEMGIIISINPSLNECTEYVKSSIEYELFELNNGDYSSIYCLRTLNK